MNKIRIVVADDHPAFREGLCRFLEDEEDLEVVAKTVDGEETVRLTKELLPDVVIIDVAMPTLDGIEAAKQIKAACPATAILMVSAFDYESYVLASLRTGAAGYMLKGAPISELISAVRLVCTGEAVFDLKALSKVFTHINTRGAEEKRGPDELHHRELEVLKLAARAETNREIARELGISEPAAISLLSSQASIKQL